MAKIIRYVTGIPKGEIITQNGFEEFKSEYALDNEHVDVRRYFGPLKTEDFEALRTIFCSDQFRELGKDKDKFLARLRMAISGGCPLTKTSHEITKSSQTKKPLETKHVSRLQISVSNEFLGELERSIQENGMPSCAIDALNFVKRSAENRGLFVPISYSYSTNGIEDLSYDTENLVFIDNRLEGRVGLKKTKDYVDSWAGDTEDGKILINVLGQKTEASWNSWQTNSLRWIADPIIRNQILSEKEEGILFTRL